MKTIFILLLSILISVSCSAEDSDEYTVSRDMQMGQKSELGGLGELTLERAIRIAMENNLRLKNTWEDLKSSKSSLRTEKSAFYPTFDATGAVNQTGVIQKSDTYNQDVSLVLSEKIPTGATISLTGDTLRVAETMPGRQEDHTVSIGIDFTQPILKGGGIKVVTANLEKAANSLSKQRMQLSLDMQALILRVTTAYYGVLKAELLIQVREDALAQSEDLLRSAGIKLKLGEVAELDVFRADLRVKESKDSLIRANESYNNARDDLLLLLQLEPETMFEIAEKVTVGEMEVVPQEMKFSKAATTALTNRLELKQQELDVENSDLSVLVARNDLLHEVNLVVSYGMLGEGNKFDTARWMKKEKEYIIGVEYTMPFFKWTEHESLIRARIDHKKLLNSYEEKRQDIVNEVRDAVRSIRTFEGSLKVLSRAIELARESYRLNKLSYDAGLISNVDLLLAQDDLTNNETNYFTTFMDYKVALVRLEKALGVLVVNEI